MTTFEYDGKPYELKLTRAGVAEAEAQGLYSSQIAEKPFSSLYLLFFAALHSKYPTISPPKARTMLDTLLDAGEVTMEDLFSELAEAYGELFSSGGSE